MEQNGNIIGTPSASCFTVDPPSTSSVPPPTKLPRRKLLRSESLKENFGLRFPKLSANNLSRSESLKQSLESVPMGPKKWLSESCLQDTSSETTKNTKIKPRIIGFRSKIPSLNLKPQSKAANQNIETDAYPNETVATYNVKGESTHFLLPVNHKIKDKILTKTNRNENSFFNSFPHIEIKSKEKIRQCCNMVSKKVEIPSKKQLSSLKRSSSAAAALGREPKIEINDNSKSNLSTDVLIKTVAIAKRNSIAKEQKNAEKRFVSKLEQLQSQIEYQRNEIVVLNERLKNKNIDIKFINQLNASGTHSSADPHRGPNERPQLHLKPKKILVGDHTNYGAGPIAKAHISDSFEEGPEFTIGTMASSYGDKRFKSLDFIAPTNNRNNYKDSSDGDFPRFFKCSSLVSLNGNRNAVDLADENETLKTELQEMRDHAELLEFRMLEFTEGVQGTRSFCSTTDRATNTGTDDVTNTGTDDVTNSVQTNNEDLSSLPLSLDSGLELNIDFNSRLAEYRKSLSKLESICGSESTELVNQLNNLLNWVSSFSTNQYEQIPPLNIRSPVYKKMNITTISEDDEHHLDSSSLDVDLGMLATRLEESMSSPNDQDEILKETIIKLRKVDSSLTRLKSRVTSLSLENKDLQEALATLHESHETRTEASGTESELVHGKTPSIHSDLSDTESDDSSKLGKHANIDTATSFQESGIFVSSCEMLNVATQTCQDHVSIINILGEQSVIQDSLITKCENDTLEIDLQAALARLTLIKDVVKETDINNICTQEYQINDDMGDELLENTEKITLSKIEYDNIVSNERKLQQEIEVLRYERDQISVHKADLEQKVQTLTNAFSNEELQVLKAQLRHLEEKLEITERYKREYFDEKCEFEEAENDARLLSQRLESQLEASREMESLLSASLSQEQEFCRELQRRVREMHEIDKERRKHEEVLEEEIEAHRRLQQSHQNLDTSSNPEITFALYGIILAHYWRNDMALQNPKAIVPYSSIENSYSIKDIIKFTEDSSNILFQSNDNECQSYYNCVYNTFNCVPQTEIGTQTEGGQEYSNSYDINTMKENIKNRTKHSSNNDNDLTSEEINQREQFYFAQIEALQKDRKRLREDYESEQSVLLEQLQNIKNDRSRVQQSLEECQREKCRLLFKLEESQIALTDSEMEREDNSKELKKEFQESLEIYQQEHKAMQLQYEDQISEMKKNAEVHEERFTALLQQYSVLQRELEPYFENISSRMNDISADQSSGKIITTKHLLSAVRELIKSETLTKQKLRELEKKECAYRETINEADRIMSNHVTLYTQRIEDLEAKLDQKSQRIKQLETSEDRLRSTMKGSWKSNESARITELLDRLVETENSELNLKERVWNLEKNGKELQIKIFEAEKAQENLRSELRDQEELIQRVMTLATENNALASQLHEAQQAVRRTSDIQQNENYLNSRVEELESSENNLRCDLNQAKQAMKQKERKILNLEEEITNLRAVVDERLAEFKNETEINDSMRQQNEDFKNQIQNLNDELKESSSENISHESQHRSEVTKLRSQLKLTNSQLTDLDSLNGELREQLSTAESAVKKALAQLEERTQVHEKEVASMNIQLNQKDKRIEDCEKLMQQEGLPSMLGEMDYYVATSLMNLQQSLEKFTNVSKTCEHCNEIQEQINRLNDSLRNLNQILNGRFIQSDSELDDLESIRTENSEMENTSASKHSEEIPGNASLTNTNWSLIYNGGEATAKSLPAVPPRLRRDAKRKIKTRRSISNDCSLLDELKESLVDKDPCGSGSYASAEVIDQLQEKVQILEEAVARKNEELLLVDGEASDLHLRLVENNGKLANKAKEISYSNEALVSLKKHFSKSVQEYERNQKELEAKHKMEKDMMSKKVENLKEEVQQLCKKASVKDNLIGTLVKQIQSLLRPNATAVLVTQIKRITENKTELNADSDLGMEDFDVEKVCTLLQSPLQVPPDAKALHLEALSNRSSSTKASIDSGTFPKRNSLVPVPHSARLFRGVRHETPSASSTKSLPPIEQPRKSRIPRLRPLSCSSLKHVESSPPCILLSFNKHPKTMAARELSSKRSEAKHELKPLAKTGPKSRHLANVAPKTKTANKEESASSRFITDARKIKRMITGLVPINADVDCTLAPEWKKQPLPPTPSCVPRPSGLRITRRVGIDGAVIAWKPLDHDCVAGFQVIVGGRVVQQVRSPHRTKALVTGLPFPGPFTICLVAITDDGRCSIPTAVTHELSSAYKPKVTKKNYSIYSSPAITPRQAVTTNL